MVCLPFVKADVWRDARLVGVLVAAMRSWRGSRDGGVHTLPRLHAVLRPSRSEMLGPCLDSVFRRSEHVLGRALVAGAENALSADETMLVSMMTETGLSTAPRSQSGVDEILENALRSARVLWSFAGTER